jgi:hypothetical protein
MKGSQSTAKAIAAHSVGNDIGEVFLAELRDRRERLQELLRLVRLEAHKAPKRPAVARTCVQRVS